MSKPKSSGYGLVLPTLRPPPPQRVAVPRPTRSKALPSLCAQWAASRSCRFRTHDGRAVPTASPDVVASTSMDSRGLDGSWGLHQVHSAGASAETTQQCEARVAVDEAVKQVGISNTRAFCKRQPAHQIPRSSHQLSRSQSPSQQQRKRLFFTPQQQNHRAVVTRRMREMDKWLVPWEQPPHTSPQPSPFQGAREQVQQWPEEVQEDPSQPQPHPPPFPSQPHPPPHAPQSEGPPVQEEHWPQQVQEAQAPQPASRLSSPPPPYEVQNRQQSALPFPKPHMRGQLCPEQVVQEEPPQRQPYPPPYPPPSGESLVRGQQLPQQVVEESSSQVPSQTPPFQRLPTQEQQWPHQVLEEQPLQSPPHAPPLERSPRLEQHWPSLPQDGQLPHTPLYPQPFQSTHACRDHWPQQHQEDNPFPPPFPPPFQEPRAQGQVGPQACEENQQPLPLQAMHPPFFREMCAWAQPQHEDQPKPPPPLPCPQLCREDRRPLPPLMQPSPVQEMHTWMQTQYKDQPPPPPYPPPAWVQQSSLQQQKQQQQWGRQSQSSWRRVSLMQCWHRCTAQEQPLSQRLQPKLHLLRLPRHKPPPQPFPLENPRRLGTQRRHRHVDAVSAPDFAGSVPGAEIDGSVSQIVDLLNRLADGQSDLAARQDPPSAEGICQSMRDEVNLCCDVGEEAPTLRGSAETADVPSHVPQASLESAASCCDGSGSRVECAEVVDDDYDPFGEAPAQQAEPLLLHLASASVLPSSSSPEGRRSPHPSMCFGTSDAGDTVAHSTSAAAGPCQSGVGTATPTILAPAPLSPPSPMTPPRPQPAQDLAPTHSVLDEPPWRHWRSGRVAVQRKAAETEAVATHKEKRRTTKRARTYEKAAELGARAAAIHRDNEYPTKKVCMESQDPVDTESSEKLAKVVVGGGEVKEDSSFLQNDNASEKGDALSFQSLVARASMIAAKLVSEANRCDGAMARAVAADASASAGPDAPNVASAALDASCLDVASSAKSCVLAALMQPFITHWPAPAQAALRGAMSCGGAAFSNGVAACSGADARGDVGGGGGDDAIAATSAADPDTGAGGCEQDGGNDSCRSNVCGTAGSAVAVEGVPGGDKDADDIGDNDIGAELRNRDELADTDPSSGSE